MKNVVIFGGTTEGRLLCEYALSTGYNVELYVATDFGEGIMAERGFHNIVINVGRLDQEAMREKLSLSKAQIVIDATHPYANLASENIENACALAKKLYLRCKREKGTRESMESSERLFIVESVENACIRADKLTDGRILATTGSKEIHKYKIIDNYKNRVIARVLPFEESIELCRQAGIFPEHILPERGPFTVEQNIKVIKDFDIKLLITKDGGAAGGFEEKLKAAENTGIMAIIVADKNDRKGMDMEKIKEILEKGSDSHII